MDEITINSEIAAEKSFACESTDVVNHAERGGKHDDMVLTLPKSSDIFVDDQTPTPTRLIRNCEEVGLFDDLQHVNPFEETFRRAVEQNAGRTPTGTPAASHTEDDTLHTPQVFAQLEEAEEPIVDGGFRSDLLQKPLENLSALGVPVMEDLAAVPNTATNICAAVTRQNAPCDAKALKYRLIAEKPTTVATPIQSSFTSLPPAITLIQPQVITLSFPNSNEVASNGNRSTDGITATAIPVQTVKPFILPKPTTTCAGMQQNAQLATFVCSNNSSCITASSTGFSSSQSHHEPSSASLTPTSQLPIKERLKAILSQGSRSSSVQPPPRKCCKRRDTRVQAKLTEDCIERRRAAATRYRKKMHNEHMEIRQHNIDLKQENMKLRERVRQLEHQLAKQQEKALFQPTADSGSDSAVPAQVQIPASTVHLVMNIPKMVVSAIGQPPVLQNPITYRLEKK